MFSSYPPVDITFLYMYLVYYRDYVVLSNCIRINLIEVCVLFGTVYKLITLSLLASSGYQHIRIFD